MSKVIGAGVLFLLTGGLGICLSSSGKPYGTLIFTIHKLVGLAAVIFAVIVVRNLLQGAGIEGTAMTLIIVTGASILALFVTGGLLGAEKEPYMLLRVVHIVATCLALPSVGALFYLLGFKK